MKRFFVILTVNFLIFSFYIHPSFAKSKKKKMVPITAESAILVNLSKNKIIYAKNIHTKRAPASTVKILTALVALEKLGTEAEVIISKNAHSVVPSKVWLTPGTTYNSLELIQAVLISSANDASIALAEAVSGTEEDFAGLMNNKAKSIGARNSNFINASGLPAKNQYSTAYDLYLITKIALKNPLIYQIMKKKKENIRNDTGKSINLVNHNKLLFRKSYPLVLGKTGYTINARHCYAGIVYFDKKQYAVVILKSKKPWTDIENLLKLAKE